MEDKNNIMQETINKDRVTNRNKMEITRISDIKINQKLMLNQLKNHNQ